MPQISFLEFDSGSLLNLDLKHYMQELRVLERTGRCENKNHYGSFARRYRAIHDNAILSLASSIDDFTELRVALRPYNADWQNTYILLLKYFMECGYSFRTMQDFTTDLVETPTVFLRFDVHCRDLPGLYGYLDVNKAFGVSSNAYLFWDYSDRERAFSDNFLRFRAFASKANCKIGFHTSAVDSHLIWSQFSGSERQQVLWSRSQEGKDFFEKMMSDDNMLDELICSADEHFDVQVKDFKEHFPDGHGIAAHGGAIGWILRNEYGVQPAQIGVSPERKRQDNVWNKISARGYLTYRGVERSGLGYDSDGLPYTYNYEPISDSVRDVEKFLDMCEHAFQKGRAIELLLHPATFSTSLGHWNLEHALIERMGLHEHAKPYFQKVDPNSNRTHECQSCPIFEDSHIMSSQYLTISRQRSEKFEYGVLEMTLHRNQSGRNEFLRGGEIKYPFKAGRQYRLVLDIRERDASLFFKPWIMLKYGKVAVKGQMVRKPVDDGRHAVLSFVCEQDTSKAEVMLEFGESGKLVLANQITISELDFPYINKTR